MPKMREKLKAYTRKLKVQKSSKFYATVSILACGLIGLTYLALSVAAPFTASFEAESGTIVGSASVTTDQGASDNHVLLFGHQTGGEERWKPALNTPWMWMINGPINIDNPSHMGTTVKDYLGNDAPDPVVYGIDGFDNTANTVASLHARGKKAICYVSAGSSENWRPDFGQFVPSVMGNPLDGWPGERWLDIRNIAVLEPIMKARIEMCANKGFDAVEFDNVDGYSNNSGFPLTAANQINYNTKLAQWAHEQGMAAALKNAVELVPQLWREFDFAINESCNRYQECSAYSTHFIANNKAVFQVEYPESYSFDVAQFCENMNGANINALRLPRALNGNRQPCR